MPIFLDPVEWFSRRFPLRTVPYVVNPDGSVQHVYCDGARFHVLSWSTQGRHCSEPNCEVNRERQAIMQKGERVE